MNYFSWLHNAIKGENYFAPYLGGHSTCYQWFALRVSTDLVEVEWLEGKDLMVRAKKYNLWKLTYSAIKDKWPTRFDLAVFLSTAPLPDMTNWKSELVYQFMHSRNPAPKLCDKLMGLLNNTQKLAAVCHIPNVNKKHLQDIVITGYLGEHEAAWIAICNKFSKDELLAFLENNPNLILSAIKFWPQLTFEERVSWAKRLKGSLTEFALNYLEIEDLSNSAEV